MYVILSRTHVLYSQNSLILRLNQNTHQTMNKKERTLDSSVKSKTVNSQKEKYKIIYPKKENIQKKIFGIVAVEKDKRSTELIGRLMNIWEASVRASHHFQADTDISKLTRYAENALLQINTLWVIQYGTTPVGFMGVQEQKIEMLFLHPDYFRKGLGKKLVQQAFDELGVEYVDVNEQNANAKRFYEQMGFKVFKRNEFDSEGNPFPILEMKRESLIVK